MTDYIADSAVFIMGYAVDSSLLITVPSVVGELKSSEAVLRFDLARESGALVEMPEPEMRGEVLEMAKYTRDIEDLSSTDVDILAKALEYKDSAVLLTDDYAVQNVASLLGIEVKPVAQKNISDILVWEKQCIGCRKRFDKGEICSVCGSLLKKRRKRKL
ncbi:MAG: NOB1 family endonuclease [Methanosarcinaceae archaeon]|nr:NOB1 family endonuclease [Methanosarcinaceae archaeon]